MRLELSVSAQNLPKSLLGGAPDPLAVVTLLSASTTALSENADNNDANDKASDNVVVLLGQTEVLSNTTDPDWTRVFYIEDFCLGQSLRLIVSLYDNNNNNNKTLLGSCLFEVGRVLGNPGGRQAKSLAKDASGVVILHVEQAAPLPKMEEEEEIVVAATEEPDIYLPQRPTFVSYIQGGCELRVQVAIDATASNGDPRQESSLHYFDNHGRNAYETCLLELCSLLAPYDSDQTFPVRGFGAQPAGDTIVRHCFDMAGHGQEEQQDEQEEVEGVEGILEAYRTTFRSGLVMSSPRNVSQVILQAASDATQQLEKGQYYSILLIFTNGVPADPEKTLDALKEAAEAPLSVVMVGVGPGDFAGLQELEQAYQNCGLRDCLRFVHYEALKRDPRKLSQAALDPIPDQLVEYMFVKKGLTPQPRVQVEEITVEPYSEDDDVEAPIQIQDNGQAVVTGPVPQVPSRQQQFTQLLKSGRKSLQEGRKMLRQNRRIVAQVKRGARTLLGKFS